MSLKHVIWKIFKHILFIIISLRIFTVFCIGCLHEICSFKLIQFSYNVCIQVSISSIVPELWLEWHWPVVHRNDALLGARKLISQIEKPSWRLSHSWLSKNPCTNNHNRVGPIILHPTINAANKPILCTRVCL